MAPITYQATTSVMVVEKGFIINARGHAQGWMVDVMDTFIMLRLSARLRYGLGTRLDVSADSLRLGQA